jgi:UDP-N-acetylglucosamine 2-epimerase (non-hydrolysing)
VVTLHCRESQGEEQRRISAALRQLADRTDVELAVPLHRFPAVRRVVVPELAGYPRIQLLEPLPYTEMVGLLQKAYLLLTDSGGLQEEAPSSTFPCLSCARRPSGSRG